MLRLNKYSKTSGSSVLAIVCSEGLTNTPCWHWADRGASVEVLWLLQSRRGLVSWLLMVSSCSLTGQRGESQTLTTLSMYSWTPKYLASWTWWLRFKPSQLWHHPGYLPAPSRNVSCAPSVASQKYQSGCQWSCAHTTAGEDIRWGGRKKTLCGCWADLM